MMPPQNCSSIHDLNTLPDQAQIFLGLMAFSLMMTCAYCLATAMMFYLQEMFKRRSIVLADSSPRTRWIIKQVKVRNNGEIEDEEKGFAQRQLDSKSKKSDDMNL